MPQSVRRTRWVLSWLLSTGDVVREASRLAANQAEMTKSIDAAWSNADRFWVKDHDHGGRPTLIRTEHVVAVTITPIDGQEGTTVRPGLRLV